MHEMTVVHCPQTTGGNPQGLCDAERRAGLHSYTVALTPNQYDRPADSYVFSSNGSMPGNEWRRWCSVLSVLRRADVIHFNAGRTLCPQRLLRGISHYPALWICLYNTLYARWCEQLDLRLARLLGKVIAVTYQGSDARQQDYCKTHYPIHFYHSFADTASSARSDRFKRERIALFDRYADLIYAVNPDILRVLPERARFMPYASVNPREWGPHPPSTDVAIPHVVHAPSDRQIKGTDYILDAFTRLQAEGVPFRYTLVEHMPHAQVKEIYASADLLVDQLLAGYYGALAVELMALAKPVICYLREEDFHVMPEGMRTAMPLINATPESIYNVLKSWLTERKSELHARGLQSRAYVEQWHDPEKISAQIIADYRSIPAHR